jgi:hypothetical protein
VHLASDIPKSVIQLIDLNLHVNDSIVRCQNDEAEASPEAQTSESEISMSFLHFSRQYGHASSDDDGELDEQQITLWQTEMNPAAVEEIVLKLHDIGAIKYTSLSISV